MSFGVPARGNRTLTWCIWTAVLASVPYVTYDITGQVAPGRFGVSTLGAAIALSGIWMIVTRYRGLSGEKASGPRSVFVRVGAASTVMLLVIEGYAVLRGSSGLGSEALVSVNETLSFGEFWFSVLAMTGWVVFSGSPEGPTKGLPRGVCLSVGVLWSGFAGVLASVAAGSSRLPMILSCAASGLAVCLCARMLLRRFTPSEAQAPGILCGCCAFRVTQVFAQGGSSPIGFFEGPPHSEWYWALLALCLVVVAVPWLVARRRKAEVEAACHETAAAPALVGERARALTGRESEVLARTVRGETAGAIASAMGIAESTVSSHRRHGYEKLSVAGKGALLALAREGGVEVRDVGEGVDEPSGDARSRTPSAMLTCAWAVLVVVAIAAAPPTEVLVDGEWVYGIEFYASWGLGVLLLAIATVVGDIGPAVASGTAGSSPLLHVALLCSVTLLGPIAIYFSWVVMPDYRLWASLLIVTCLLALGIDGPGTQGQGTFLRTCFVACGNALRECLATDSGGLLLVGAGFAVAQSVDSLVFTWQGLADLIVVLSLVAVAHVVERLGAGAPQTPPPEKERERALKYLEGRGMGELQAKVTLDLCLGYGTEEVASLRDVSIATVKSYRFRSYRLLGVHGIGELRELLADEANFTS